MLYGTEKFIRAHQDVSNPYYNHSYDRYTRDTLCSGCGRVLGEQTRYPDFEKSFSFGDEKDKYLYCPYCGHEFDK